jgi:1-acyl-sn-glycerol-3-phosphate acyltransferase
MARRPSARRPRASDPLKPLRYLWRVPLLVIHVFLGILLTLLVSNPITGRRSLLPQRYWDRLVQRWSRAMLRLFGFRTRIVGNPAPDPALFVANHVSWLDIQALHAARGASFVAKAEIARWPLVGWLASQAGTIFHKRGSNDSLARVMDHMRDRLRERTSVAVFPEGGTGTGERLRPFHARIFQVAMDTGAMIQPVAIVYGDGGRMNLDVPFQPGEKFFPNAWRLLGQRAMDAEVHFLEPLAPTADGRRQLAELARGRIAAVLGADVGNVALPVDEATADAHA